MIPKDPVMLLSMVNLKLRDYNLNLDDLCAELDIKKEDLENKLKVIDYHYDAASNQFR